MDDAVIVISVLVFMSPCLLGYTEINDPILKYMCSSEFGADFWKNLLQCSSVLNSKFFSAINTCIPSSSKDESETTRMYICSSPEKWVKMMDCVNMHLIQIQDQKDPSLDVSPGMLYRTCVNVLMGEAAHSEKTGDTFLGEISSET